MTRVGEVGEEYEKPRETVNTNVGVGHLLILEHAYVGIETIHEISLIGTKKS